VTNDELDVLDRMVRDLENAWSRQGHFRREIVPRLSGMTETELWVLGGMLAGNPATSEFAWVVVQAARARRDTALET
jgi:hypothetical protein